MEQKRRALTEGRAGRNETPGWKCRVEKARLEKQGWKKRPKGKNANRKVRRLAGEKA